MSPQAATQAAGGADAQALRAACGTAWDRAARHRFVQELAADTLGDDAYRAYLVQDELFLDALVRLVAHAAAVAPGMPEQRRLAGFLTVLTSEENDYFERSFEALGVSADERARAVPDAATLAFGDLFRAARHDGSYVAALAALLPVEWIYLDWATWAARDGVRSGRFWLREWVAIHSGDGFAAFVAWLRAELERELAALGAPARRVVAARFRRAVELEAAFFDAAVVAGVRDG